MTINDPASVTALREEMKELATKMLCRIHDASVDAAVNAAFAVVMNLHHVCCTMDVMHVRLRALSNVLDTHQPHNEGLR
jgi:hypothetical protein